MSELGSGLPVLLVESESWCAFWIMVDHGGKVLKQSQKHPKDAFQNTPFTVGKTEVESM